MTDRFPADTEFFRNNHEAVATAYYAAFQGPPLNEDPSIEEALADMSRYEDRAGFTAFLDYGPGIVRAGAWYYGLTPDEVATEKGAELRALAATLIDKHTIPATNIVYQPVFFVNPTVQRRGLARPLHERMYGHLAEQTGHTALLLTKIRDDNHGIIKVNERLGNQRSEITQPVPGLPPAIQNRFWYRIITAD